jgi:Fe-S oxidoreductase
MSGLSFWGGPGYYTSMEGTMEILKVGHFPGNIIFIACFLVANGIFAYLCFNLIRILLLAKPEETNRFDQIGRRIRTVLYYVFGQARVAREPAGIGHFLIFWTFIFLTIGYLEEFARGVYHEFSYEGILAFLTGETIAELAYGLFILIQDLLCFAVFIVLCISLYRRYIQKPLRLQTDDAHAIVDATIIIGLIMSLLVLMLALHGVEGVKRPEFGATWMPIGKVFSNIFDGLSEGGLENVYTILWWVHTIIILYFLTYLPRSKHMHLLGAIPNVFMRSYNSTGYLPKLDLEDETLETYGANKMEDFSWKQLMDSYACTECGRCQANCPAFLTDKPLTPYGMIHHLKLHILPKGKMMLNQKEGVELEDTEGLLEKPIVPDVVEEEAVMSCTTCGACMEECPVFNEHIPKIVDMRRYLVLTEAKIPSEGQLAFRNMENQSNPWGMGAHTRGDWAKEAGVQTLAENPDVEYLYFVGCAASFDERNKKIAFAVTKILKSAGISFGILGTEEGCCGDSARRLGNEYLFQMMAATNVEVMNNYNVKKVICSCPHGLNCLKNDYPQFGGNYEVYHHTEIIHKLLEEGKLKLTKKIKDFERVTYHDPCYLGRHNKVYFPPRNILNQIPGIKTQEMARNSRKSFCCGGGGGRMWLEEHIGKRINVERTEHALAVKPDRVAVACPFCLIMFDEGLKAKEAQEYCKALDVSEIVAQCIEEPKPAE